MTIADRQSQFQEARTFASAIAELQLTYSEQQEKGQQIKREMVDKVAHSRKHGNRLVGGVFVLGC